MLISCLARLFLPRMWSIEPTNVCNLRCPECPSGSGWLTRGRGYMSLVDYARVLDVLTPWCRYLTLYMQGEPTLHPAFAEMVRMAKGKKIYVATSTNGQCVTWRVAHDLVLAGLDKIIVSVDGATQSSYERYRRGGNLEKAWSAVRLLSMAKRRVGAVKPKVEVQMLVFSHNEHEIALVRERAMGEGADDFVVKTAQFYAQPQSLVSPPTDARLSRYETDACGALRLKRRLPNRCWHLLTHAAVTWQGDVVPCVFDKDARYVLGNLLRQDAKSIWRGEVAEEFRRRVWTERREIDICRNCCY